MNLSGINFYTGTYDQCLGELSGKLADHQSALVVTPNPEMLYGATRDNELLEILQKSDYALPDGAGIFVAYQIEESRYSTLLRILTLPLWCFRAITHTPGFASKYGERITGSRLTRDLLDFAAKNNISATVIDPVVQGGSIGDKAKKASQETIKTTLESKYPGIDCRVIIADTVSELINLPTNGLIFATHGNGKQEKLLSGLMKKFPDIGVAIGVGGSIDIITGFRSPAPRFFQRFGGEWLYRLYKNPKRHFARMKKVITFLLNTF